MRLQAQQNIGKAQQQQKRYHDQGIRPEKFNIGDKVLVYDTARDKHFTEKFKSKWKKPYYIYDNLENRAFKLRTIDGKLLAIPLNIALLKSYFDHEKWKPIILIEN